MTEQENKFVSRINILRVFFLGAILSPAYSYSQAPDKIHFQFTVKDSQGTILADSLMGARIKVIDQTSHIYYQERHVARTNPRGLVSIVIGEGIEQSGSLSTVKWDEKDNYTYIKTEIDPKGGKIYSLVTYNRINKFPYALMAKNVESFNESDPLYENSVSASFSIEKLNLLDEISRPQNYPGDFIGGGIAFYVDQSGENGLLASTRDIAANVPWSPNPQALVGAISLFDGSENTDAVLNQYGAGLYAAYICDTLALNAKSGWYLPSSDELSRLFDARFIINNTLGEDVDARTNGIFPGEYWSSTERDAENAMAFKNGLPETSEKNYLANVRAIRKFHGLFDVKNASWTYLGGPEKEGGTPVRIVENTEGDVLVDVKGKRGTVFRDLPPTKLPVKITFNMKTEYDPGASEPPYELFGTGDFRLFFGGPNKNDGSFPMLESNLGDFEGVQFRIFPNLDLSPIRRYTGEESHTSTSIWIRYIDPDKILGSTNEPHTGLVSDACQNRNNDPRHNCGWSRVALLENGLGLENGEETQVTVIISEEEISFEANGRKFSADMSEIEGDDEYSGDILRFDTVTDFAIDHTNISRGHESIQISDLRIFPLNY